ncbi:signal peptidase I [Nocardioides sp. LHG3406-4]|uniref:signal peptidase I n=1 Tax=Nocardioides sp. LHG3406-4 TaxID=2804575 RepID=UPI003CE94DAD
MIRPTHIAREVLLTVGAVLGVVCVLATVAALAFGVTPLVFRSGSMAPTIPTGSLALARDIPATDVKVGDVVSVPREGTRISHRVTIVEPGSLGGRTQLTLRGDANELADATPYVVERVDLVFFHVDGLGYAVAWLSSPAAAFVGGGLAVLLVMLAFRRGPGAPRRRRTSGPAATLLAVTLFTVVGGAGASRVDGTFAAFTDSAGAPGGAFATTSVPPPASFTCGTLGFLSVRFNWTAVPGATSYTVHSGLGGDQTQTVTGTTITLNSALDGGTAWVEANRSYGSTTWTSAPSQTHGYTVAVLSLCV